MPFERLIAERTWIRFFRWMRGHVSFHVARILERLEADRADKLLCWIMLLLDVCSQHLAILEIFSTFTATKNAPSIFLVLDEIFHVVKRTSTNVALNTMIFLGPHSKLVVPYLMPEHFLTHVIQVPVLIFEFISISPVLQVGILLFSVSLSVGNLKFS